MTDAERKLLNEMAQNQIVIMEMLHVISHNVLRTNNTKAGPLEWQVFNAVNERMWNTRNVLEVF